MIAFLPKAVQFWWTEIRMDVRYAAHVWAMHLLLSGTDIPSWEHKEHTKHYGEVGMKSVKHSVAPYGIRVLRNGPWEVHLSVRWPRKANKANEQWQERVKNEMDFTTYQCVLRLHPIILLPYWFLDKKTITLLHFYYSWAHHIWEN